MSVGSFSCQRHHFTATIRFKRGFGSEGSNEGRLSVTLVPTISVKMIANRTFLLQDVIGF